MSKYIIMSMFFVGNIFIPEVSNAGFQTYKPATNKCQKMQCCYGSGKKRSCSTSNICGNPPRC